MIPNIIIIERKRGKKIVKRDVTQLVNLYTHRKIRFEADAMRGSRKSTNM